MKTLLLSITLALGAQPCFGMFCDDGVVSKGDTQMEVLKRCDNPDYVTSPDYRYSGTRGRHGNVKRTTVVDWIYNFVPRQNPSLRQLCQLLPHRGNKLELSCPECETSTHVTSVSKTPLFVYSFVH